MYYSVNRTLSMAEWQPRMVELLGKALELEGMQSSERETTIVNTYRQSLKAEMATNAPRSAYVRVLNPVEDRPKYHLVYLTAHPRGINEFMEKSESVDLIQRQVRAQVQISRRDQTTGTTDMFGAAAEAVPQGDGSVSGGDVENFWIGYLRTWGGMRRIDAAEFANILERTNWFPGDLQASLVRLIYRDKRVTNVDAKGKRPKKPLHFLEGETLRLEDHSVEHHYAH